MAEQVDFDNPWRKVYEWKMAATWICASAVTLAVAKTLPVPTRFGVIASLVCAAFGLVRSKDAIDRQHNRDRIKASEVEFITIPEIIKTGQKAMKEKNYWLGTGFRWTDIESNLMHNLIGRGIAAQLGKSYLNDDGAFWLHGLAKPKDVLISLANLVGHTLLVGTTRVGKTRILDLLIAQAIIRGEPVIVFDPKGDKGLAENMRRVCEALGQPERYIYFHPAHPEKSVAIDPLRNWNSKTELASRLAALIPSETGADPFQAFGWKVLNDIINGLISINQRPNLVQLRRYIEGGPDDLVLKALKTHFKNNVKDWEERSSSYVKAAKGNLILGYITFYKQVVIHDAQSVGLDGLISTFEHNRDHFQKMIASLIPILSMLTSDPLTDLLSPNYDLGHDKEVTDMARAIRHNKVVYIGLDSLANSTVGSAIGSILLADLAAVAGDRYNYDVNANTAVNVYLDEAYEVINVPAIQLMNKGGGANFRVTIATQTFADFAARLGDENKARQVLANTNNKIALRILDAETQKYFADGIPKIKARSMAVRYGHQVDPNMVDTYTASYMEQATEEEADLIPPGILGELPPLHYFARLSGGKTIKGRIPILV